MRALKRTSFAVLGFVAAILLLAYVSVLVAANSAKLQDWLKAELRDRTGYEIAAGESRLDPLLRLNLSAVTVSKASKPVLKADRILVVLNPLSWFFKSIHRLQLVKPTLNLDLGDLFDSAGKSKLDISIRHLNIEDGTVVLVTGDGHSIDFRTVTINAENVNLGQATGLNLRTDVPWLEGVAEIVVTGDEKEKKITIRVEQNQTRGFANLIKGENQHPSSLDATV